MKKYIQLTILTTVFLSANEVLLEPISVNSTTITEVSQNAQTSADLAQTLSANIPSIDMSRRSAIANDIYIRGQKRDNISVEVDGSKVCGACPNRMDPPISHILSSQIDEVKVIEGPYDVETFGVMGGAVKVTTKKPTQEMHGEFNLAYGSWNYLKAGVTLSGGNDSVRLLISASTQSSDQYKDGDGNTLSQQVEVRGDEKSQYQLQYKDRSAYLKKSFMTKAYVNITDDQELQLSYTGNRSDNVLYSNSKVDAIYDDSNIYNISYNIKNINEVYKNINLQYYYSDVDHPMGTDFRNSSEGILPVTTHQLQTQMQGLKLKNSFDINQHKLLIGLDTSNRVWDGTYFKNGVEVPNSATTTTKSIDNANTKNIAIFASLDKSFREFSITLGARYDSTEIISDDTSLQNNNYTAFNSNIVVSYKLNPQDKFFIGLGQASRVPDARELYFKQNSPLPTPTGRIKITGTDTLKQSTNTELDFGYEASYEAFNLKIKGFYSMLDDYIYYQKNLANNNFVNLDATVYGAEFSSTYYLNDETFIDVGVAYKRGTKNDVAQTEDKDLADMAPLRANLMLNYEYANNSLAYFEVVASDKWDKIDSVNGEQVLAGWTIFNAKVKHTINKNTNFTFGIDNILDKTYALSNTYADLILITAGSGDIMLLNEPGRYIYTNLDFRF